MPSIKDLKKRIGTVKNTQQTTKAMKMVAAARLRRSQEAIVANRPFSREIEKLIRSLAEHKDLSEFESPFVVADGAQTENRKVLIVVVSSDRGLCGGFNGSVIKAAQRWIKANESNYKTIHLGFVGRKAFEFFRSKRSELSPYYTEVSGKVSFQKARILSDALIQKYLSGEYNEIKIIFNEFKNAIVQKVVIENFLPLVTSSNSSVNKGQNVSASSTLAGIENYGIKPGAKEIMTELLKKQFAIQSYRVLLESQASEHGARMSAMENATKNASEMIKKLTLVYNKQRQAVITKELLEIISGSESQKTA